jgi:hypothetical protein
MKCLVMLRSLYAIFLEKFAIEEEVEEEIDLPG